LYAEPGFEQTQALHLTYVGAPDILHFISKWLLKLVGALTKKYKIT
jgi:hypothetical protein